MSDHPQKKALPRAVEARKFAQKAVQLSGFLPVDTLVRLQESVHKILGVETQVAFARDASGYRILTGQVSAEVERECQRCMNLVTEVIQCDLNLAMVWDDEQAKQLTQYDPWIVGEDAADLYAILEEELLLGLPHFAYHDYDCVQPELFSSGDEKDAEVTQKPNPFEKLKALKGLKKS